MLKKRVITTLCLLPVAIVIIWFGDPWFTILLAIVGLLAVYEFYGLVAASKLPPLTYFGLIWTLLFILSRNPNLLSILEPHFDLTLLTPLLLTSAVVLSLTWLLLRPHKENAFSRWVWTMAGIFYVGWLLSYLTALRGIDAGRDWVFLALFTNAGSDTTAFFIGKTWGRHHLAPSISPNKTWEGAIAGLFGAIIIGLIFVTVLNLPLSYAQTILLSLLVSIFGQLGDLAESLFKRNTGVKESGKLLPGHGGLLDRMDSLIFSSVLVYYFALACNAGWFNWL